MKQLSLLSDFLSGCFQHVVIEGCQSDWAPVQSGGLQGSILGRLFFFCLLKTYLTICHALKKCLLTIL